MTDAVLWGILALGLALRIGIGIRRRRRRQAASGAPSAERPPGAPSAERPPGAPSRRWYAGGDVVQVAAREIRERLRARVFRIGTLVILAAVVAAIVIPAEISQSPGAQRVGIVEPLPASEVQLLVGIGRDIGTQVILVREPSVAAATAALKAGRLDVAIVGGRRVVVNQPISSSSLTTTAVLARDIASVVGLQNVLRSAGLTPAQGAAVVQARPLPIQSLAPPKRNSTSRTTTLYGLIVIYILLTQYGTWLLMGVVEEKSSRVIEVLLSTLRPSRLLAGKVLGIGSVVLVQSALIVAVALISAEAVGSSLLHGSSALDIVVILVWMVLAYVFYCWIWAAAGSLVERQSQVQSLAFPLQLPVVFGYIVSLTAVASANASLLVKVLAYFPPTAPFAMPALVALGQASWWQDALSAAETVVAAVLVARVAAFVYYRAILRTGGRVHLREVFSASSGATAASAAGR